MPVIASLWVGGGGGDWKQFETRHMWRKLRGAWKTDGGVGIRPRITFKPQLWRHRINLGFFEYQKCFGVQTHICGSELFLWCHLRLRSRKGVSAFPSLKVTLDFAAFILYFNVKLLTFALRGSRGGGRYFKWIVY